MSSSPLSAPHAAGSALAGWATTRGSSGRKYAVLFVVVSGLYVGAAKLGIELSVAHGVITPVWAPTGIALAALVLFGRRLWPAVALGAFVANATSGAALVEAAAIASGNTLEAVVGATLLARVGFRPALDRVRDVLALIILGAVVSTAVSATNGVTTLWLAGDVSGSSYASEWLLWWVGDGMGDLIVAPLLLVWLTATQWKLERARALEGLGLLALLVGSSVLVFIGGLWRYPHLLFPLLVWAPLRFRQPGAVTANFVVAAIAVAGAVNGTTPIGTGSTTVIVQILEGLLAAIAVTTLLLGAVLSERAATEAELERTGASLAEAQAVAHIGSWEWNIAPDTVTWSDELYRLFGLPPQSVPVTFESFLERVSASDRERVRGTVERTLGDGEPFAFDHRIDLPDGGTRWLRAHGRVIADERGLPVRLLGTAQDITEQRRLDELRDNILSTVSHELRTPLTSIRGFALTLQERGANLDDRTRAEIVTHLAQQSAKLERLLGDLLDMDRLRHGLVRPTFRTTDVGELVARVARDYIDDGRPIDVRAASVMAVVDPAKVERIVDNLLANAVKHTPPAAAIRVRVAQAEDGVLVAVEDAGAGVPEHERQAIFEIFNRGSAAAEQIAGAGVGLSLVAQFAALHGGRAWVEENPEGGASFYVLLPRSRPVQAA
jgi:PAS domain S-box-containing protein